MEGNQGRTLANMVRLHERSGKLWAFILVCVLLGALAGPHWNDGPSEVERQETARCRPLLVEEQHDQRSIDLLVDAGWHLDGARLYPRGCHA